MDGILDSIDEYIHEILGGWVIDNLTSMFSFVNEATGIITDEAAKTPETWNSDIFTMIQSIANDVVVPIAAMIITAILCYELINMVIDRNHMTTDGGETSLFFIFIIKACIAVLLLTKTFDITVAIFEVGSSVVTSASSTITTEVSGLDPWEILPENFYETVIEPMSIGGLLAAGIETYLVNTCMTIIGVLITVILYGRMMEIYIYLSVAPIPFATFSNKEWGSIGTNYVKALVALAFQAFFIMICVGIYVALVAGVSSTFESLHKTLWTCVGYTVLLCIMLFKTGNISRSIFNAH